MNLQTFHPGLTLEHWHALTLCEQLGNIGSEVGRALTAKKQHNHKRELAALDRALELFDLTIADPKHHGHCRELCRAREVVCDYFFGDNEYGSTPENLDRYFMVYAIAARRDR
ncbi:MAG TPA: hypothetical protein VJB60_04515 [Candidatus Peribacterales bacterium]|uniref:Uncharacterized protein n=1 Tax=Candidatus Kaiserbacteria bacterium RIFCSPHIGHO2_01_FULL_56_24 TaxID=1798487 RepID=A0A1F6DB58_9BACT|nr:MAG: hypothetical protein A2765_05445 [Candidatus Kaiserbacteria bacterium RIFCSPHIGHO2_01_FULL_56_24]HLD08298.1 hypothetical protein [Candidatus Peribacterales bacterium]